MHRREFNKIACLSCMMLASAGLNSCTSTNKIRSKNDYPKGLNMKFEKLILDAIAAPSGHNTQPWKFRVTEGIIEIHPDYSKALPIADKNNRELFISLGAALANLELSSAYYNYHTKVNFDNEFIQVALTEHKQDDIQLDMYNSIKSRHSNRRLYDGKRIEDSTINALSNIAKDEIGIKYIDKPDDINKLIELSSEANFKMLENDEYFTELKSWIRFNDSDIEENLDGLAYNATLNPSAPAWLGKIFMNLFANAKKQSAKDAELIKSSSSILCLYSKLDDRKSWIETGRQFERIALFLESKNIKNAHVNQCCQVEEIRSKFAETMQINGFPQLILRIGYAEPTAKSPRRAANFI